VVTGFFDLTGELFGLRFVEIEATGAWHQGVRRYEIYDRQTETRLGIFDMDLHPRNGKYTHAAAFPLRSTRRTADGCRVEPYAAILANLPAPSAGKPALLEFRDVETFFHEMGHILHSLLSQTQFASQAGTSVQRDFVEAPSQIMENFLRDPTVLQRFARHYRTGLPIPAELVVGLTEATELNYALLLLRQVCLGRFDLAIHGPEAVDLAVLHHQIWADTLRAYPEGTFEPASIGHFFGYDAGYYGYLWAEVRGDDMWGIFAAAGVVSPEIGQRYRQAILEPGDSRDANASLEEFLGRPTSPETFLQLRGLES
jgi:Zn-dependent oligopeptidase